MTMKCGKSKLLLMLLLGCVITVFMWHKLLHKDTTQVKNAAILHTRSDDDDTERYNQVTRNPLGKRFPRIFIIGFGKAGTRALFDTLLMHSKVVGHYKEIRFFDEHYNFGMNWYISQMPQPGEGQQVAEKSPDYVLNPKVPPRLIKIAKLYSVPLEDIRFVVMFRHPIVRALSEYIEWQAFKVLNHAKLLARFDELALDEYGQVNNFQPLNHSLYIHYVKQWLEIFNPNQFCYVNGDKFAEKPYDVTSKLEKCLDLPPEISKDNFVWEEKRQLYCLSHNNKVTCPSLSKGRPHPFIQQDVVEALMKYFKPFNEELYTVTGENYNWENNYEGLNIL